MVPPGEVRHDGPLGTVFAPRWRMERAAHALHRRVGAVLLPNPERRSTAGSPASSTRSCSMPRNGCSSRSTAGCSTWSSPASTTTASPCFARRSIHYNIFDATPFQRDVIGELAEACASTGSSWGCTTRRIWTGTNPMAADTQHGHTNCGVMSWTNDWDYPDNAAEELHPVL